VLATRQISRRSTRPGVFSPARRRDGAPLPRGDVLLLANYRVGRLPARKSRALWRDRDAVIALLVLWVASAVRVVGAFARHEVFGTEATLAFVCLVLAPVLVLRGGRHESAARTRSRSESGPLKSG
jgi:hypothetical protein